MLVSNPIIKELLAGLLVTDNGRKRPRIQTGPAHQRPIDIGLRHQARNVFRLNAAPVEYPAPLGGAWRDDSGQLGSNECMRLLGDLRGCRATCSDGPNRL